MKISYIKSIHDNTSFKFFKNIGMNGIELQDLENVDKVLENLIENDYKTFFVTNEVAGYSQDLFKKYYQEGMVVIYEGIPQEVDVEMINELSCIIIDKENN